MLRHILFTLALYSPYAAAGQTVIPCDGWQMSAENIAEPWEAYSRTFADGEVRIAVLDTIEPAAAALYLMVLTPPYDEVGGRHCGLVANGDGSHGFGDMDFEALESQYDASRGVIVSFPVQAYNIDTGEFDVRRLEVTINQATGDIGTGFR